MTTLRQWFEGLAITHIQFQSFDSHWYKQWEGIPTHLMTIQEADKWLDVEFDDGFGTQGVPDFNAWDDKFVYYVHEYDGSTCLHSAMRNPPK